MCGIVGAVAERDVAPILLDGLRRLEYRGYDSAGLAVVDDAGDIARERQLGKVAALQQALDSEPLHGSTGIAHTRWATHGAPSPANAHPHICCGNVALVHNGIIENHEALREAQLAAGHRFTSETDTEVVVHAVHDRVEAGDDLLDAVRNATTTLEGAYAIGVIARDQPGRLIAARRGSPLVIGLGERANFIASDALALVAVSRRIMVLDEGDVAEITRDRVRVFDAEGQPVERPVREVALSADPVGRGGYRHFMLKEIYEQPQAIAETLEGRISGMAVLEELLGPGAGEILAKIRAVQIVACGTSYHAGLVGKYWLEALAGLPCAVEVASEFRYRRHVVAPGTLFVSISQSGETADTLAALRGVKAQGYEASLSICNVAESSLVRQSDLTLMTHAGPEIGVASTKAFTTQLVALLLLVGILGRRAGMDEASQADLVNQLRALPRHCEEILKLDAPIRQLAERFADKHHALFLGRGEYYPIAMEGALKLKEISYIHAEAYPAGELKHGPLALIDANMPVIAVAPDNALLEKLKSNLAEVRARGGQLIVFADDRSTVQTGQDICVLRVPATDDLAGPIAFTLPLQLLAYHVAVLKGTDVDQPRNLAKSVTVE